jgi:GAF domain-containing protein
VQQLLAGLDTVSDGSLAPVSGALRTVIDVSEQVLGADCVGVLLMDEQDRLRAVASSGPVAAALEQAQQQLGVGPGVDTIRTAATVVVADLLAHDSYRALTDQVGDLGVRAIVSAPIWVNGAVAGNLNVMRYGVHDWTAADVAAAETYADVVATLLQLTTGAGRPRPTEGLVES